MNLTVAEEKLKDFGVDVCDYYFDELAPWSSSRISNCHVTPEIVGAVAERDNSHGMNYTSEQQGDLSVSFTYKPMTFDEYLEIADRSMVEHQAGDSPSNPSDYSDSDPGRTPNAWDFMTDYQILNGQYDNPWFDYYIAIEGNDEEVTYDPPGDAPWVEGVLDGWNTSVDNRGTEVDAIREDLAFMMVNLIRVADEYTDADLENAIEVSKYEEYDFEG